LHRQSLCVGGIPFVVFRLADVIGPRDSTNRFWQFLLWLKLCLHHKVPFYLRETDRDKLISLCYVKDVAMFLACSLYDNTLNRQLLQTSNSSCYNLAVFETMTVDDLIKLICDQLPLRKQLKVIYTGSESVPQILPSVSCGPISVMKASTGLGWIPSSLLNAVKDTVYFYQNIMDNREFCTEKKECMKELLDDLMDVYPEHLTESFRKYLKSCLNS